MVWLNRSEKIEHWSKKKTMPNLLLKEVMTILLQIAVNQQNSFLEYALIMFLTRTIKEKSAPCMSTPKWLKFISRRIKRDKSTHTINPNVIETTSTSVFPITNVTMVLTTLLRQRTPFTSKLKHNIETLTRGTNQWKGAWI